MSGGRCALGCCSCWLFATPVQRPGTGWHWTTPAVLPVNFDARRVRAALDGFWPSPFVGRQTHCAADLLGYPPAGIAGDAQAVSFLATVRGSTWRRAATMPTGALYRRGGGGVHADACAGPAGVAWAAEGALLAILSRIHTAVDAALGAFYLQLFCVDGVCGQQAARACWPPARCCWKARDLGQVLRLPQPMRRRQAALSARQYLSHGVVRSHFAWSWSPPR